MLKKFVPFVIFSLLLLSCSSKIEKKQMQKDFLRNQDAVLIQNYLEQCELSKKQKLEEYFSNLSLEEKIAQMFIENLEGNYKFHCYENYDKITGKKSDEDKPLIAGGYLFFSYNISPSFSEQKDFIYSIYDFSKQNNQTCPYIAIDQEGGFVNRLKRLSGKLPSQSEVAQSMNAGSAFNLYSLEAKRMKDLGFTTNLAPVIEISTEKNSEFLDGRSFGNLEQTVTYGKACINAYELNGIGTVIKHFPGNSNTDPHCGLPVISDSLPELEKSIEGFKKVIQENPVGIQPKGVLMSHVVTTAIDPEVPSCLSKKWVTDILRNEIGYKGIIFSDDIFMDALNKNGYPPEIAVVKAVDAGINVIMTSDKRFGNQAKVLYEKALTDSDFSKKIDDSVRLILQYKLDSGILNLDNYETKK